MKMITNKKAICVLISALALFALPAQASFIQELFESDGTRFGVLEFDTTSGSDTDSAGGITGLLSASVELGGITWTEADAVGSFSAWTWEFVDTNSARLVMAFQRAAGGTQTSWNALVVEGAGRLQGMTSTEIPNFSRDQAIAQFSGSTSRVAAVPTPGTLALLMVGLAGVGYSRKRFGQVKRVCMAKY